MFVETQKATKKPSKSLPQMQQKTPDVKHAVSACVSFLTYILNILLYILSLTAVHPTCNSWFSVVSKLLCVHFLGCCEFGWQYILGAVGWVA